MDYVEDLNVFHSPKRNSKNVDLKYISDDSSDTLISLNNSFNNDANINELVNIGFDEITSQLEHYSNLSPKRRDCSLEHTPEPPDSEDKMSPPVLKKKLNSSRKPTKPPKQLVYSKGNDKISESPFHKMKSSKVVKKLDRKKRNISRKTTKDGLLSWIQLYTSKNYGIWVQCSKCHKWRWLNDYEEHYQVPNVWQCSMNSNAERNSCKAPAEKFDLINEPESDVEYVPGSIVWAKITTFPWWPAMVEDDPDIEEYYWEDVTTHQITKYHVTFLDSKVTRAWISSKFLRPFLGKEKLPKMIGLNKPLAPYLNTAQIRAMHAVTLTLAERLKKYSFAYLWQGKWPNVRFDEELEEEDRALEISMSQTQGLIEEVDQIDHLFPLLSGSQEPKSAKIVSDLPTNYRDFMTSIADTTSKLFVSSSQNKSETSLTPIEVTKYKKSIKLDESQNKETSGDIDINTMLNQNFTDTDSVAFSKVKSTKSMKKKVDNDNKMKKTRVGLFEQKPNEDKTALILNTEVKDKKTAKNGKSKKGKVDLIDKMSKKDKTENKKKVNGKKPGKKVNTSNEEKVGLISENTNSNELALNKKEAKGKKRIKKIDNENGSNEGPPVNKKKTVSNSQHPKLQKTKENLMANENIINTEYIQVMEEKSENILNTSTSSCDLIENSQKSGTDYPNIYSQGVSKIAINVPKQKAFEIGKTHKKFQFPGKSSTQSYEMPAKQEDLLKVVANIEEEDFEMPPVETFSAREMNETPPSLLLYENSRKSYVPDFIIQAIEKSGPNSI